MPSSSSPSARGRRTRSWRRTTPRSRRSAHAWTACRSRSNWRLRAARCLRLPRSRNDSTLRSARSAPARATRPIASARSERRSIGATTCSTISERTAFSRFAVFARGATVDAVEAITGADLDTVDRLVAKSLLTRRHGDRTRLAMLETIREYAGERFAASPDAEAVRERHFAHFLAFAERAGSEPGALRCRGQGAPRRARCRHREPPRRARLGRRRRASPERALAMCAALARYWRMRHRHADAIRWIDAALALRRRRRPSRPADPRDRHEVLGRVPARPRCGAGRSRARGGVPRPQHRRPGAARDGAAAALRPRARRGAARGGRPARGRGMGCIAPGGRRMGDGVGGLLQGDGRAHAGRAPGAGGACR